MLIEIGATNNRWGYEWMVVGYLCTGDGIQVVGSHTVDKGDLPGRECREWLCGFNKSEEQVWESINKLPLSPEAKRQLGETGMYPSHLLDVVGLAHDEWRKSKGLPPDYHFARMVRGPKGLKTPCPF